MFCTYCGKQIENDSKFCCYCGKETNVVKTQPTNKYVKEKVFAFVGFGLGIFSFIFSLIPFMCFSSVFISIPGLIFSNLGMKSNKVNFARKGKVFSILGIILGVIMSISSILFIIGLLESPEIIYLLDEIL